MQSVRLSDCRTQSMTLLPDSFIEEIMPRANGDFVKIYIYLLSSMHHPEREISLSSIADVFSCTEKDVQRALTHWEKEGLLALETEGNLIVGLLFTDPGVPVSGRSSKNDPAAGYTNISPEGPAAGAAKGDAREPQSKPEGDSDTISVSPDRIRALRDGNQEVQQLLFLAEQYLGRTLSRSDITCILYFYDTLQMSADLLEYLIEYCVMHKKTSLHYIKKVGLEWHKAGYTTAKEAKDNSCAYRKDYFTILKAQGITNRNPIPAEIAFMDKWMNEYAFDMPVILEACRRTVTNTGGSSFAYADGILSSWNRQKIRTLKDVQAEDERYQASQKKKGNQDKESSRNVAPNRFHNFHQRDYDYDQLEKELLKNQW